MKKFSDLTLFEQNRLMEAAADAILATAKQHDVDPLPFVLLVHVERGTRSTTNVRKDVVELMLASGLIAMREGTVHKVSSSSAHDTKKSHTEEKP